MKRFALAFTLMFLAVPMFAEEKPRVQVIHVNRPVCATLSQVVAICNQQVQVFVNSADSKAEAFKVVLNYQTQEGTPETVTRIVPAIFARNTPYASYCAAIFMLDDVTVKSVVVTPLIGTPDVAVVER